MSYFLAVTKKTVVDQAFEPAKAAVLDADGNEVEPATPEVPLVTHDEVDGAYIEDAPAAVAKVMAAQAADPDAYPNLKFYSLKFNATTLRPSIKEVREKGRAAAPAREIVTIEDADGVELGSATI